MSRLTNKRSRQTEIEVKKSKTSDEKDESIIKPLKDLWNSFWSNNDDMKIDEEPFKEPTKEPAKTSVEAVISAKKVYPKKSLKKVVTVHKPEEAYKINQEWVSATRVKNYMIRDPALDWYETCPPFLMKSKKYQKYMNDVSPPLKSSKDKLPLSSKGLKTIPPPKTNESFGEYILNQGVQFELQLLPLLKMKLGSDNVAILNGDFSYEPYQQLQETLRHLKLGTPVIHGGVLMDPVTKLYGIPDLIVRSDYLSKLVNYVPGDVTNLKNGAPNLNHSNFHYRIIDIKFMTLPLRSDGAHLLNSGYIPAYKGQTYIYNDILSGIQGYNPATAYLLGRRWKYTYRSEPMNGYSCFDKLGVIDFSDVDKAVPLKVRQAIKWIHDVRENGRTWELKKLPLPRPELYPNMSNQHDGNWRPLKQEIASTIKEITSLWMCGTKHREIAHLQGIYSWADKRCSPENIGIKSVKNIKILKEIVATNLSKKNVVNPKIIKNNDRDWQNPDRIEFCVDFETLNDIYQDFSTLPSSEISPINIFMIGVGYINNDGVWKYRDFTCKKISTKEEKRICFEFANFIKNKSKKYGVADPLLYHWSRAETTHWNNIYNKYGPSNCLTAIDDGFFDLLEVFHQEPITIKGCMAFGLKEVAKALYHRKLIKIIWDENNPCSNGPDAMLLGFKAYQQASKENKNVLTLPVMKDIIKYNNMDCAVLCEIINYLRKHHTGR